MIKVWAFDCEGQMIKNFFSDEDEALRWAENHGMDIFKTRPISRAELQEEIIGLIGM